MKNVLLIDFKNEADAYEGFSKLQNVQVEQSSVEEAALVKEDNGNLEIKESFGIAEDSTSNTLFGGFIGLLFGLFTGGLGWALWTSVGILVGAMVDDHEDNKDNSLLTDMSKKLHDNHLSIIAVVDEDNYDVINHTIDGLDAMITRYSMEDIKEEIEETKELNKKIAKEAKEQLRLKKKEAREQKREARKEEWHAKYSQYEKERAEKKEAKEEAKEEKAKEKEDK
ncbi:hypothetical protein CAMA108575_02725 [Catellicoccus marimammalium]